MTCVDGWRWRIEKCSRGAMQCSSREQGKMGMAVPVSADWIASRGNQSLARGK